MADAKMAKAVGKLEGRLETLQTFLAQQLEDIKKAVLSGATQKDVELLRNEAEILRAEMRKMQDQIEELKTQLATNQAYVKLVSWIAQHWWKVGLGGWAGWVTIAHYILHN